MKHVLNVDLLKVLSYKVGNSKNIVSDFVGQKIVVPLVFHFIQVRLIIGVDVFVAVPVNGILVGFFVRQVVRSVAALQDASRNHLGGNTFAVINPSHLGEEINNDSAEVVVSDVSKLSRPVVIWEDVVIVVIAEMRSKQ